MLEIAGGILIAFFVLAFFSEILGFIVLIAICIFVGVVIHGIYNDLRNFAMMCFFVGVVFFLPSHLSRRKNHKFEEKIQSHTKLYRAIQNLISKVDNYEIKIPIEKKVFLGTCYSHEENIGNFFLAFSCSQFKLGRDSIFKYAAIPLIEILDSNKKVLFTIHHVNNEEIDKVLFRANKTNFDFDLLAKEITNYLSRFSEEDTKLNLDLNFDMVQEELFQGSGS